MVSDLWLDLSGHFFLGKSMVNKSLSLLLLVLALPASACDYEDIRFDAEFANGRLDACERLADNSFSLRVDPENTPINASPWYAFKVEADKSRIINIELGTDNGRNRYLPKFSLDGKKWQDLDYQIEGENISFQLDVSTQPIWVAGQEIIDNQYYDKWLDKLAADAGVDVSVLGKSTQGREIKVAVSHKPDNKEWLVVLGRQHPPEVTGALALFPFVETMLAGPQAKTFLGRFNVLVVANMNPDGVEHGYWRHNINGVDLNRDWKTFKQQETRLVRDKLEQIVAQGGKLVFALDFHSTHKDVFYTMPANYGVAPAPFSQLWLEHLQQATKPAFIVRPAPGNNPNRGVSKQYFADKYKIHAITYEMGDNTNRKLINSVAAQAAITLSQQLLQTPAEDFYVK